MITPCHKCGASPLLEPANIAHTEWECVCDCGVKARSARNRKGAVDNWNVLQKLEQWKKKE